MKYLPLNLRTNVKKFAVNFFLHKLYINNPKSTAVSTVYKLHVYSQRICPYHSMSDLY